MDKGWKVKMLVALQILILAAVCIGVGLDKVNEATDLDFQDTASFLQVALFLHDNGGIANFISLCLTGQFTADVQYPFYPLMLSLFASRDGMFFVSAKLLALLGGVLVIVFFFLVTRDLYGDSTATLAATMLVLNGTFVRTASHVQCETFLMLFVILSAYATFKGAKQPRYWAWAGFAAGFAYLTKGTGLLLLIPGFAVFAWLQCRMANGTCRHSLMFGLMFLLAASPHILRNMIVYGTPFYGGGNSASLWIDHWAEAYSPYYGMVRQYPELAWQFVNPPTMTLYFSTHSLMDIQSRMVSGIWREAGLMVESLNTVLPVPFIGILLLILCGIGLAVESHKERVVYVLVLFAAFFFPFAWFNQVGPELRYLAPLVPIVCLYAARGLVRILILLPAAMRIPSPGDSLLRWVQACVVGGLVFIGGYAIATQDVTIPRAHVVKNDELAFAAWVSEKVAHQDLLLFSYWNPYWSHSWALGLKGKIAVWRPDADRFDETSIASFNDLLKNPLATGNRYIVIHQADVFQSSALARHFYYDKSFGLSESQAVEGWKLVYTDPDSPRTYLVYEVVFGRTGDGGSDTPS
jgi:4-amino-4-deoxy-L-arabinose transferase-like glycosyltransferase